MKAIIMDIRLNILIQISEEILELVSLLISSVELPDLFTKIEVKEMKEKVLRSADAALKLQDADNASWMDYFRTRAENNLHVVLCINPSNKILMYKHFLSYEIHRLNIFSE